MHRRYAAWLVIAALAGMGGCLVVTPLDDLPGKAGSSSGGSPATGGAPSGGNAPAPEAGEAGDQASAGQPPLSSGDCTTNAECMARAHDAPARCLPDTHSCVNLRSNACPLAYGDAADPNAIVFGAFATLNPAAPEDNAIVWAHRLALDELSGDNIGGLPGPGASRRPLVMVVCDNTSGNVDPALKHLIEEVQVPAIIGTLKPGDLRRAYENYVKRDIFYLSPVTVTETVAQEDANDHVWGLLGEPQDFAPTYAALLALSEKHVRSIQTAEEQQQPLRVALVSTKEAYDSELADAVAPVLRFNGKTVAENGDDFNGVTIGSKPNFAELADDLAQWSPDIVISTASETFLMTNGLQQALEDDWKLFNPDKRSPFYILSPFDAGNLTPLLARVSGRLEGETNSDANEHYVGVSIASAADNSLQNDYARRLGMTFKGAISDTANYYDAIYYLAYAMYAANQPDGLTGTGISQGMKRLLSGNSLDVGPTHINETFKALADGKSTVHVRSTLGPPDFDAETGVRPIDGAVFCFTKVGTTAKLYPDALRYNRQTMALGGEQFPCISGFFVP